MNLQHSTVTIAHQPCVAGKATRLQQALQRLRVKAVDAGPASPEAPAGIESEFITADEAATLSSDQLAFLTRKRKAACGLGPIMPPECSCQACAGVGIRTCHQCGGSGQNATDKSEELFANNGFDVIKTNNGLLDPRWLMAKGGPCWLCKGSAQIACPDCSGTGINGGVERYTGD